MKEIKLVLGFSKSAGISKKKQAYDIRNIYITTDCKGWGDDGEEFGFKGDEFRLSKGAYDKLVSLDLDWSEPVELELEFGVSSNKSISVIDVHLVP